MQRKMKVAVMTGLKKIDFEERRIPSPRMGEVLVKIEYVGICGSDVHYFEEGRIGDYVVNPPFVLGHEASGKVVELGDGVTHLKVGDSVALEPGRTCGKCIFCKQGMYNLCPDVQFFATPPVDGVFLEYVVHDASLCFKLPDEVSTLEGALIEPLAVGFHAAGQGEAQIGKVAVIFGSGCIGLCSLLALQAMGVSQTVVVDMIDSRLKKALELGATNVVNGKNQNLTNLIYELTDGRGVDIAIETSGSETAARQAVEVAKKGSILVMVGYSKTGQVCLPMSDVLNNELTIKTVFRYRHRYPMAIAAVASKKIDLKNIVTKIYDFGNIQEAMEASVNDKENIVKSVIRII